MTSSTRGFVLNIIWFQLCWFACVLLGNPAAMLIVCAIAVSYLFVPALRDERPLIIQVFLLGLVFDTLLIQAGILAATPELVLPPLWLSALWLAFATTLNHSLKPLLDRPFLFMLLAVTGGPLCYRLGTSLSEVGFGLSTGASLVILAAAWLAAGFLILTLYRRWRNHAVV